MYCRPILVQYGLWDQVRVDQGKEWVLMLYIQEMLAHQRRNTDRAPHLQSTSKQVHCALKDFLYYFICQEPHCGAHLG